MGLTMLDEVVGAVGDKFPDCDELKVEDRLRCSFSID